MEQYSDFCGLVTDYSATIMSLTLNAADFHRKVIENKRPVVVDVWASWCHNCKVLEPVFREAAATMNDKADFYMLKADDNRDLVKALKIMGVPTLLFYRHGILIAKKPGVRSKKDIARLLEPLYAYDSEEAMANEHKSLWQRLFGR